MPRLMHKLLLAFAVVVLCSHSAFAQKNTPTPAWNEASILATTQGWADMMGNADVAALQGLLDEKYMHIHGTGRFESKEQFLEAFKTGARRYEPLKLEDVTVRIFGKTAIVNGVFALKAHAGGKVLEGVNRFGLVIVKTAKGNKIVSFQATALPKP